MLRGGVRHCKDEREWKLFVFFLMLRTIIGRVRVRTFRWQRPLWLAVIVSLLESLLSLLSSLGAFAPATWPVFAVHAEAEAFASLVLGDGR